MSDITIRIYKEENPIERAEQELSQMDVVQSANIKEKEVIEFHLQDQDVKYPSALVMRPSGRVQELTLRFGPLGDRTIASDMKQHELEGKFTDTIMDAASSIGAMEIIDEAVIDLGDGYVSDYLRPHVRLHHNYDGYDIRLDTILNFIQAAAQHFERKFGTLEDRYVDPEYAELFKDKGI